MSTGLLHYRAWRGTLRRPLWSVFPIARVALSLMFRRWLFWVLYGMGLLFFLMFFFGSFLLDWMESQVPAAPIQVGNFRADPDRVVRMIRQGLRVLNGSQETFAYFFLYQSSMVMIVLAMAGSILVGNDFTYQSLTFYLAKPLSRWHYIAGKCLAVGVIVNLMTTVPALVLYVQHGLDDVNYFLDPDFFENASEQGPASWPLLLGILGFGLLLSVVLGLLLVTAASWLRRTMPLIMAWSAFFLFFKLLAAILVNGLHYADGWRLIDLWNDLCLVGFACLGFDDEGLERILRTSQPQTIHAGLVLVGVCISCLTYLTLRTRAVEVVR
jgi:ABC-2 type transport system permease protein